MEKSVLYSRVGSKEQVYGKWIDCGSRFTKNKFENFCNALEREKAACVHTDCVWCKINNYVQETYKNHLVERYGERLSIDRILVLHSYYYRYTLK